MDIIKKIPDDLLVFAYKDAINKKVNKDFIELLLNEITRRKIQHLLIDKNYENKTGECTATKVV